MTASPIIFTTTWASLGAQLVVKRNDALTAAEAVAMSPQGIILSPGPCTPNEAGICLKLIEAVAGKVPLLGVCLGHQALGQAFGGKVVRAPAPIHGKLSQVSHRGIGVFQDIPTPFTATRYHSLIVDRATLPDCLEITAETERRPDHGHAAPRIPAAWRAVPSREHRIGARPPAAGQFPAHRRP